MDQSVLRISKELRDFQKSSDLSIAVEARDSDIRNVRASITGPYDTPYQYGFFEFEIVFPKDYPTTAPSVVATTTAGGTARFNPNIYANGKVCLSILGTWPGTASEQWTSAQGLESVLWSIQSLMSANPYENEPGFRNRTGPSVNLDQEAYILKIRHETLRITVIERLENYLGLRPDSSSFVQKQATPEFFDEEAESAGPLDKEQQPQRVTRSRLLHSDSFKDLYKRRFLWYYGSYILMVDAGQKEGKDGQSFKMMPFEHGGNQLKGSFQFAKLKERLIKIKTTLDLELVTWKTVGLVAKSNASTTAVMLYEKFLQIKNASTSVNEISLDEGNPFVWNLAYFGQSMTKFDGATLCIKLHLSPNFPQEQPRAICEKKIFHQSFTPDGLIAYTVPYDKSGEPIYHVEAITDILEDESPTYDPRRVVNPEASALYWGKEPKSRREYNRRLRESCDDNEKARQSNAK